MIEIRLKPTTSFSHYRLCALNAVATLLKTWCESQGRRFSSLTIPEVARNLRKISHYPHLEKLRFIAKEGEIITVQKDSASPLAIEETLQAYLGGKILVEDTAAGEASRLAMGNKWFLKPLDLARGLHTYLQKAKEDIKSTHPSLDELLAKAKEMADIKGPISLEKLKELTGESIDTLESLDLALVKLNKLAKNLLPISLGIRHKLQYVYDLIKIATSYNLNIEEVLKSQWTLTVLNEENFIPITREIIKHNYFGLEPSRFLFAIQPSHPGIEITEKGLSYSPHAPWHLWNHGDTQIMLTMDNQIFRIRFNLYGEIEKDPLKADNFEKILAGVSVKVSYPIEDLDYLTQAININNLAQAFILGKEGYQMIMEVAKQKVPPQKGGFWAFNEDLGRAVMIETDWGGEVIDENDPKSLAKISYLNRNFNLYPNPVEVWKKLKEEGLPVHIAVKNGYLYLAPPQGDQNFLVPTAFIQPEELKPLRSLKTVFDIPETLEAMKKQDEQEGFRELAQQFGVLPDKNGKITFSPVYIPILPPFSQTGEMLTLENFNLERFIEQLDPRSRDHFHAALEICKVIGSLVRKYEIDQGKVYLETIPESRKGEAIKYPSKALKQKVLATDSKAHLALNPNRLYFGERYGFAIIDIPNKQTPRSGEVITLIVKIRENISKEKIRNLFEPKFRRVLEKIRDKLYEVGEEEVKALFFQLPLKDIFLSKATELVPLLLEKLTSSQSGH
jgi:hypothetical protein